MEALIAAIFFITVTYPGHQPFQLSHPLPLSECLEEARLFLSKNHEIDSGAQIQAGCIVTVAPSIHH